MHASTAASCTPRDDLQRLLETYREHMGTVAIDRNDDGTVTVILSDESFTGPAEHHTWDYISTQVRARLYGYLDLDHNGPTFAVLDWLHANPELLATARPLAGGVGRLPDHVANRGTRALADFIADQPDSPVTHPSSSCDMDRIAAHVMATYTEALGQDLVRYARALEDAARELRENFLLPYGPTPIPRRPFTDTVNEVAHLADGLRERINTVDDAAEYLRDHAAAPLTGDTDDEADPGDTDDED